MEAQHKKTAVALVSVVSNATLVALKIVIGLLIGSVSVISEAIHSGVDLLAALIALFAVRASGKPADPGHPFGHGKFENLSGTAEALLIFVAAGWIIWEAVHRLVRGQSLERPGWGIAVMAFSAAVNTIVSGALFNVGRETDSPALQADAWHLRTDVWTSLGVMGGLGAIAVGHVLFAVNLHWLDPVAAIAVALLIVRAAWRLTHRAGRDLLDVSLPAEEDQWIREYLDREAAPARGYHHLRTRKAGAHRFVEFHLWVDPEMSVEESHALGDRLVAGIKQRLPRTRVIVHVEPYGADHQRPPRDSSHTA